MKLTCCPAAQQVVVVLSGSMEPAFYRGDILFLNMGRAPFRAGEVVVFNINGRDIPIVHRIIKVHEKEPGGKEDDVLILTKVVLLSHPPPSSVHAHISTLLSVFSK
jgi:signal peptidase I